MFLFPFEHNIWPLTETRKMGRAEIERRANILLRQLHMREVRDLSRRSAARDVVEELGYEFIEVQDLEWPLGKAATAYGGQIDYQANRIAIATRFSEVVQRFTAFHEVGHLLLHRDYQDRLHRDIPLSGEDRSTRRPRIEREADAFAGFFLMPRRMLQENLEARFGISSLAQFDWSNVLAFHLAPGGHQYLLRQGDMGKRARSLAIATAEQLGTTFFTSMANAFRVSATAMAIQLELTNLVD